MDISDFNLNSPLECEAALELNERFIHRYVELLDSYSTLPGCDALVYNTLKSEFPKEYLDSLPNFTFLPPPGDPAGSAATDFDENEAMEQPPDELDGADFCPDSELPPTMRKMRQIEQHALGIQNNIYQLLVDWCNLYAAVIPAEHRGDGLKILVNASLVLAYLRSAMEQMPLFQFTMCQKLTKRAQDFCRILVRQLQKINGDFPQLNALLDQRLPVIAETVHSLHGLAILFADIPHSENGLDGQDNW